VGRASWWADTESSGPLVWTLDGKEIGRGPVLALDPRLVVRGTSPGAGPPVLTLTEPADGGGVITDSRSMGDADA
jgi:hypothetical protein